MRKLAALAFCFVLSFVALPLVRAQDSAENTVLKTTVRLQLQRAEGNELVTGHGAAFAVDLSDVGLTRPRYLLSAAHLVLDRYGRRAPGHLTIEVDHNGRKVWEACKVVAVNRDADLCLLESPVDLPNLARLGRGDERVGEALLIVGCPKGVPPCVSHGQLTSKEPPVSGELWEARAKFWHGNSGGPVFDAKNQTLAGVAVAGGMDDTGDMDPHTALFTPMPVVRKFLKDAIRSTVND